MFRIVKESYEKFVLDFIDDKESYRYLVMKPFELLIDINMLKKEKNLETDRYKKLEDFVWRLSNNIEKYDNFKCFLWTLESRGIYGKKYGILSDESFNEQVKIVDSFLRLSYWN